MPARLTWPFIALLPHPFHPKGMFKGKYCPRGEVTRDVLSARPLACTAVTGNDTLQRLP